MDLLHIFVAFTNGIADIQVYRASVAAAAERELQHLLAQKKLHETWPSEILKSTHNLFFHDATGRPIFYGFRQLTIEDAIQTLIGHTNRQYQWLLAEAYELFEEYLKRAYAHMGLASPTLWPLRDFGSAQWMDIAKKDFDWFLMQARQKKDAPLSMIRQFDQVLPLMHQVRRDNALGVDLWVAVLLVAQTRHQIVHGRGVVEDRDTFAKQLLSRLGISGASASEQLPFIQHSLILNPKDGAIRLLNLRHPDSVPGIQIDYDLFDGLVRFLLIYAHQLYLALGGVSRTDFDDLAPPESSDSSDVG